MTPSKISMTPSKTQYLHRNEIDEKAFRDLLYAVENISPGVAPETLNGEIMNAGAYAAVAILFTQGLATADIVIATLGQGRFKQGFECVLRLYRECQAVPDPDEHMRRETEKGFNGDRVGTPDAGTR